ncbi:MAG: FtsQ-type POTRA domain-containing protein [Syntrophomonadaceae bacterium]|nr:FtsQ-type POTRA domain-containing protein [Syntrophomonadaceae bacterium]
MAGRNKVVRKAMGISLFMFVAFLSVYFFIHSSFFDIEEVSVSGNRVVMTGEIKALSGIVPGANIFEVDTASAAAAVAAHPMVNAVQISRHLPNRMEIKLTERQPWAVIPAGTSFLVIDDCGVCIDRLSFMPGSACLIVTVDDLPPGVVPGKRVVPGAVRNIQNITSLLPRGVLAQISEFHAASNQDIFIYTLEGTEIRFGNQDRLREKVVMVREILDMERELEPGEALEYVDLRYKGQPVVKYRGR